MKKINRKQQNNYIVQQFHVFCFLFILDKYK